MPWYFSSLLFLFVLSSIGSQHLPTPIRNVAVAPGFLDHVVVTWPCYELGVSYKFLFLNTSDGTTIEHSFTRHPEDYRDHCLLLFELDTYYTYKLNMIGFNEHGEASPSPDLYFYTDPSQNAHRIGLSNDKYPAAPRRIRVKWNSENRANVAWDVLPMNKTEEAYPIEYTFHYADTKNLSVWNTIKNQSRFDSYIIAISPDEDMTGLSEPVITIEHKNGVSSINCTLPPNTRAGIFKLELTVGSHTVQAKDNKPWVNFETKEEISKAMCTVSYNPIYPVCQFLPPWDCYAFVKKTYSTRTSTREWGTSRKENTEYAKQKEEGGVEDPFLDFRN